MQTAPESNRAMTVFWHCLAMFGPPALALFVRTAWTSLGVEPAHGVAVDLPAALPAWSRGPEVITAGFGLSLSQVVGLLALLALVPALRRPLVRG